METIEDGLIEVWVVTDSEGNVISGNTTNPEWVNYGDGDEQIDYQYSFKVTNEQLNDLWMYKVVYGKLVEKVEG